MGTDSGIFQYEIKFRPTTSHMNADCLSRLPVSYSSLSDCPSISAVFNIHQIAALPVTAKQIALATLHDPVLSRVLHFTRVLAGPSITCRTSFSPTGLNVLNSL